MMGTDDLKGYVLLTDCRTALKASNARTLMCKDLRVQFRYAAPGSEEVLNKLTIETILFGKNGSQLGSFKSNKILPQDVYTVPTSFMNDESLESYW